MFRMLAIPEEPNEMRLWGSPPPVSKDSFFDDYSTPSFLEYDVAAEVECGQGLENADCWYSESTSATSSVDSSEYNSDDGFVDIESEDVKISAFSGSYLDIAELERKCKELKAVENSSLSWTQSCSRKSSQRNKDSKKSSLLNDILRRSKQESERSSSSKSRNKHMCPCQKLKESMKFGLSWNKMSSDDRAEAVECLTRAASLTMGLQEQMEIIRIINPEATVLPTDTEFEIDLDTFNDVKFQRIHGYVIDHLSRDSCPLCTDSQSEMCRLNSNFTHRKHLKRKPRGTLSMKRIPRKSSKHKGLLKRVQRQMLKEQRSGLFENEEVISLSSRNKEDANDVEIDILC